MKAGDWVEVQTYDGKRLRRRVVAVEQGKVYIALDDEFEAAKNEGREPPAVGFRPEVVKLIR